MKKEKRISSCTIEIIWSPYHVPHTRIPTRQRWRNKSHIPHLYSHDDIHKFQSIIWRIYYRNYWPIKLLHRVPLRNILRGIYEFNCCALLINLFLEMCYRKIFDDRNCLIEAAVVLNSRVLLVNLRYVLLVRILCPSLINNLIL